MPTDRSPGRRSVPAFFLGLVLLLMPGSPLQAQGLTMSWDASAGFDGDAGRFSLAGFRHVGIVPDRWSVGLGIRATAYGGAAADFRNRGSVAGALTDRVSIDPAVYGINAAVATDLRVAGPVHLEFNLDLAGFAAGPERRSGSLEARPSNGSLFLYESRDRGSLNSELAVSLVLSPRFRLRAGSSHYVLGYTVTDRSSGAALESRYQRFFTVPFLAISMGR